MRRSGITFGKKRIGHDFYNKGEGIAFSLIFV